MNMEAAATQTECPYEMNDLLELMVEQEASDLHLQVKQPPTLRISGAMVPVDGPPLTPNDTKVLMEAITSDAMKEQLKTNGGADFGFAYLDRARFRVSTLPRLPYRPVPVPRVRLLQPAPGHPGLKMPE